MIAISSFRPKADCTPVIWANQVIANATWREAFNLVVYFGHPDPELDGAGISWVPCDGKPAVADMCAMASKSGTWACLINADIVIAGDWERLLRELEQTGVKCAISKRWEIPANRDLTRAQVVDEGLDWFAAKWEVWDAVRAKVPREFHLGRILWDTWMLSFFLWHTKGQCADCTPARVIYHPKHDERKDQHVDTATLPDDGYIKKVHWPRIQIGQNWRQPVQRTKRTRSVLPSGGGGGHL